ncbi:Psg1p [Lachancea thermotolerans CBS 6340]|uniref:KLTH0B04400p n=1 Tax=Lachancea thermotolerans (strain ATCC 56472 / CBS 6340 / NRRL Y-8284) TaxID=559295 RepID=C5DCM9_LACTC|nr:KLTH0B04400p [Lachancea thermotolerans CBS 6340]CAR21540.1 KLTH0B04400p [Lachancea thermotolerans CBS 6340]
MSYPIIKFFIRNNNDFDLKIIPQRDFSEQNTMLVPQSIALLLLAWLSAVDARRNVIKPKETTTTSEIPKPWLRTIYSGQKEVVTPTVIAGVTFSAKPLATTNGLEPWISLDQFGSPKTKRPQIKGAKTKDARPDYSTYFKTVATRTLSYDELKAHNMEEDEVYEEEVFTDEDDTYVSLNPIIRCTPDRYFKKGPAGDISSEPFCTPKENKELKVDNTYFVSWYTKFFQKPDTDETIENVQLHLFYVKESIKDKGLKKRDLKAAFFSSGWLKNVDGIYPLELTADFLDGAYDRKVLLAIQPDNIRDDEFNPWEHYVLFRMIMGPRVAKTTKQQKALQDAGISDDTWYYVALSIPTVVVIACVAMYFFLYLNRSHRDIHNVKDFAINQRRRVLGKFKDFKKYKKINNRPYSELPTHTKKTGKQN